MTDKRTGLVWLRCPAGYVAPSGTCDSSAVLPSTTWQSAMLPPEKTPQTPPGNWRLASIEELESIAAKGCGRAFNHKYIEINFDHVWSSSSAGDDMVWLLDNNGRRVKSSKMPKEANGSEFYAQTIYVRNAEPQSSSRPVELIVPFSSGGAADQVARIFIEGLAGISSNSFNIVNRPGDGGTIGANLVASARPDGQTLAIISGNGSGMNLAAGLTPISLLTRGAGDRLPSTYWLALVGPPAMDQQLVQQINRDALVALNNLRGKLASLGFMVVGSSERDFATFIASRETQWPVTANASAPKSVEAIKAEASAAFKAKDYATSLRLNMPLAQQGDVDAQLAVAVMYDMGLGTFEDATEGARWFRLGAKQGNARMQRSLGMNYAVGRGVPQDRERAYVWVFLAVSNGFQQASEQLELIAKGLTPQQIAEAQTLAKACQQNAYKGCD